MQSGTIKVPARHSMVRLGAGQAYANWLTKYGKPKPPTTGPPVAAPTTAAPSAGTPFGSGWGVTPTPTPSLPPPPAPIPQPTPNPLPTPSCTIDWTSATNEIKAIVDSIRNCSSPNATLPAEIADCPSGSGTGVGSRGDYTSARASFALAKEDASILCAAATQQPSQGSPYSNQQGQSYYSPYTPYGQNQYGAQTTPQPEETPMIAPDTSPLVGRRAAFGIGGALLLGVVAWAIMRRRKSKRA